MSATSSTTGSASEERAALDRLCIDTIRVLSADAVQQARSGHPGLPMAMAPVAHVLYGRMMRHDPGAPGWPDRDRFILSAGHGSMLLYSALHLAGYDLPLQELMRFRQWGSRTPGHPERILGEPLTPGVETTTGPLGQGFANGVGMALAERFLRERFGAEMTDHRIFGLCSDGDLMEGVSAEAASLAGHLGLGRLVYVYDDNRITIDGDTSLSFSGEDVEARFRAYGWHTTSVEDVNDMDALEDAISLAIAEESRPSLIRARSVIGYPSPAKMGTSAAHGAPLGEDELRRVKLVLGFDPNEAFVVPEAVREYYAQARTRGERAHAEWRERAEDWALTNPDLAEQWQRAWAGRPSDGFADSIPSFRPSDVGKLATRAAGGKVMAAMTPHVPAMVGGSADLVESTKTELPGAGSFTKDRAGANVHWGVREHAMGAAVNGMALHGGVVRPFGSTFLVFSDYMRPAIRLSALMRLPVTWIFTHDSVAVGEDGPTHQPVEHYAALRGIPGLTVIRPADANETAAAWRMIVEEIEGPVCLLLSRQDLPVLDPAVTAAGVPMGGYVLAYSPDRPPDVVLVATGAEVHDALAAFDVLAADGIAARVVSMPSWELYDAQPAAHRQAVLPEGVPVVSVEAGVTQGWQRFADSSVGIDRFGASAPGNEVLEQLGISPQAIASAARAVVAR